MFLTSRDEEFDRVLGLELGADDYLCKPFSLRELAARVKVLFRRAGIRAGERDGTDDGEDGAEVVSGPLSLDTRRFTASWKGTPVRLTVTEFRILHALARQAGFVQDPGAAPRRGVPARLVHERPDHRLPHPAHPGKLELADDGFDGIETLYGLGYRWRAD